MNRRAALSAALLVGALSLTGCSGSNAPEAQTIEITVDKGQTTPAGDRFEVRLNGKVTVRACSDVKEHIHVHGYEKEMELEPGQCSVVEFTADTPGVFEIESHVSNKIVATLAVRK